MELESFSRHETSPLVEGYGTIIVRSHYHVGGVAPPSDDLVEEGCHQHSTGALPSPAGVHGHGEELAAPACSGSAGRSVSQGLQYPAPVLDQRTGGAGRGLETVVPEEALVQAGHVQGPGNEPGGCSIALCDDQERVCGRADPPVQVLQEVGTQQGEESPGYLGGVEVGCDTGIGRLSGTDGNHRRRVPIGRFPPIVDRWIGTVRLGG
jgi:hypothetical protein